MEDALRRALLFDFYSQLLTDHQRQIYQLHFNDDLSLGEIGDQTGTSRQAVYDIVRRAQEALETFESKLDLVDRHMRQRTTVLELLEHVDRIKAQLQSDGHGRALEGVMSDLASLREGLRGFLGDS